MLLSSVARRPKSPLVLLVEDDCRQPFDVVQMLPQIGAACGSIRA